MNIKQTFDSEICSWKYPRDASRIARLSIEGFQMWYLAQDQREMVFMGQFKEFQRFIYIYYTLPVKLLRLYYKVKRIFSA